MPTIPRWAFSLVRPAARAQEVIRQWKGRRSSYEFGSGLSIEAEPARPAPAAPAAEAPGRSQVTVSGRLAETVGHDHAT